MSESLQDLSRSLVISVTDCAVSYGAVTYMSECLQDLS